MSMQVLTRVLRTDMKSRTDKLVLMTLAEAGHDDGSHCYPGVALLARRSCVTERNVQLSLRRLEAEGWISVVAPARQHRATEYRIEVARLAQLHEARGVATDTPDQRPGVSPSTPLSSRDLKPEVSPPTPGVSERASRGVATDTRSDRPKEEPVLLRGSLSSSQGRDGDPVPVRETLEALLARIRQKRGEGPAGCEDPLAPASAKSGPREAS